MQDKTGLQDGIERCWWCGTAPLYTAYHDQEWGRPVYDDRRLFEKVCLEGFQAGLSWITILRKRDNFRRAFRDFDFNVVSRFGARDVSRLLKDEGTSGIAGRLNRSSTTMYAFMQAMGLVNDHVDACAFRSPATGPRSARTGGHA